MFRDPLPVLSAAFRGGSRFACAFAFALVFAFVFGFAVVLMGPTAVQADPAALEAQAGEVRSELVGALEDLAKWAGRSQLFGKRDETWERVLDLEPDHERARAALKYERERRGAGGWVQSTRYTRPRDRAPASVAAEWEQRLEGARQTYRDGLLAVAERARDGEELTWAADRALALLEQRPGDVRILATLKGVLLRHLTLMQASDLPVELERVTSRLDAHFPSDPEVRAALGEVLVDGRWLQPATARSTIERQQLATAAKAALDGVPPVERGALTAEEEAVGLAWTGVHESLRVRVVGTTSASSLQEIARSCEAAGPFFEAVFGRPPVRPPKYTLYVFPLLAHWQQFAERFAGLPEPLRSSARQATGSGFPLGTTSYACLPVGSEEAERDLCVDVVFQTLLYQTFATWHAQTQAYEDLPGWVRIGMSDYLTWRLIGTRILTTVGGEYARPLDDPDGRSPKERKGWLAAARRILEREGAPGTRLMLGKTLGAFQADDAVTSFAFASYLIEGLPEKTPQVLDAVGGGAKAPWFAHEVLGCSLEGLHVQWLRWLDEAATTD